MAAEAPPRGGTHAPLNEKRRIHVPRRGSLALLVNEGLLRDETTTNDDEGNALALFATIGSALGAYIGVALVLSVWQ